MNGDELQKGWRWVRLGSLLSDLQAGFASSARSTDGVRQLRMNNVGVNGKLDWSEFIRVPTDAETSARYSLQPGDLVFNNTNSAELVGKSALVDSLDEPTTYSNHLTRLRFGRDIEPRFIAGYLKRLWNARFFEMGCDRWVGQAAFQRRKLVELTIPLPPLSEQRRIADAIDAAMAEAEAAARAIQEQRDDLERLEFRIFETAFPVPPLALDANDAPKGWTWHVLTDVARLESGHTPSRRHPEWWGGDTPWIALPDIRALDGATGCETAEAINEGGLANSSARLLPAGTVCLSRTASVGFVTVMGRPMATSQDFVNWVCGERLNPWFLAYTLIASRCWLRRLASGAIHKTIYMPTLKALRICIPSLEAQKRIVFHIERCRAEIAAGRSAMAAQKAAADMLPSAILTAAFRGEL